MQNILGFNLFSYQRMKRKAQPLKKAGGSKKSARKQRITPKSSKKNKAGTARSAEKAEQADREKSALNFPIVAIGGSAGAFKAIEKFFTHMPSDRGIAFVIVMHLDPSHKGFLSETIQNFTPMKVLQAEDGMRVQPDQVYVIPSNKDMAIHKGKLLLLNPAQPRGYRMPIDYFFQSSPRTS
jgi:two-component system, chemotaxis family, CheB/CheR fusion protein